VLRFEFETPMGIDSLSSESSGYSSWLSIYLLGDLILMIGERNAR
jgi:hypothetical protein